MILFQHGQAHIMNVRTGQAKGHCVMLWRRAKFIVGSVALLMAQQGGGAAWLQGLRDVSYPEASEALCTLPGVGPKVSEDLAV